MRVGDGRCPNSFRATDDNSTAYAGSFSDYNTATATGDNSVLTQAAAGVTGDNNYGNTATNSATAPDRCLRWRHRRRQL